MGSRTESDHRARELLVLLGRRWSQGLPAHTAAKVLRRRGINPWSLLAHVGPGAWERLGGELGVPAWVMAARGLGLDGFGFVDLPRGRRVPGGLVMNCLEVVDSNHLRRLPRRFRGYNLFVARCRNLESLPRGTAGLQVLHVEDCPRLGELHASARIVHHLVVKRCAGISRIRLAPEVESVTLASLPGLRELPPGRHLADLRIWSCRGLEDLSRIRVSGRLWLQGCARLRSLPACGGKVEGRVRDCPVLARPPWPWEREDLDWEAREGASFLPPPEAVPGLQPVRARPLLEVEEEPAWPWPPAHASTVSDALAALVETLDLGPLESAHCLAGCGPGLRGAIRERLAGAPDPAAAVRLGAAMLAQARRDQDRPGALAVCLALEDLGLGVLSSFMLLERMEVHKLEPVLGREWAQHFRRNCESIAGLGASARDVPGPLVLGTETLYLDRADPILHTRIEERSRLRRLEGPVWAARSLWIRDCPDLEALPALMVVHGDLTIRDCPALREFPSRIEVDGDLVLSGLPRLVARECRVRAGGRILRDGAPGLVLLASP